ncbi:polymorphic toxin-type HINT domain-containing protein [Streptomyces niveus]
MEADELTAGQWLQTCSGTWVQISAVTHRAESTTVYNLTVDDIHTYYVLAGAASLLVHNCGVGLGCQKAGAAKWADGKGFTHFMGPQYINDWSTRVRNAIDDPNTVIHVYTEGFVGGFEGMATVCLAGGKVHATQQEMSWLARAVIGERRSWDSTVFHDRDGKVDVLEPKWHEGKWYTAWTLEWAF